MAPGVFIDRPPLLWYTKVRDVNEVLAHLDAGPSLADLLDIDLSRFGIIPKDFFLMFHTNLHYSRHTCKGYPMFDMFINIGITKLASPITIPLPHWLLPLGGLGVEQSAP